MMSTRAILVLFLGLAGGWLAAHAQELPAIQSRRRGEAAYMDSLARVGRLRYAQLGTLPAGATNDTLRFKSLYWLARLYKTWPGRRDSTLHYGNELIRQARIRRNRYYEINGKLLLEEYYRTGERDMPRAMRLNLDILAKTPPDDFYKNVRFQANLHLGSLYSLSGDHQKALRHMNIARQVFIGDTLRHPAMVYSLLIDLEQHVGFIYDRQHNLAESEAHFLMAESMLVHSTSDAEHGYVYDDLAEFYLRHGLYAKALVYGKKAEAIWSRIRVAGESRGWGTLACIYARLEQDEQALFYAQNVLRLTTLNKFATEQAYEAIYVVAERQHNWHQAIIYYKKYVGLRDSIEHDRHRSELITIEKQAEYEQLALQSRQTQLLQAEQFLLLQKETELDQLRANAQADKLFRRALETDQQRMLETERATALMARQQVAQRMQEQAFDQKMEQQASRTRQNWLFFSLVSSILLLIVLAQLLYSTRLRKRQADANLRMVYERKAADARIIETQESERQRLAADLHDDLGGTLATLSRRLTDIREHLHDADGQQAFDALLPLVQKSSDDLRRIAHNLMPPEFARIGLRHALEQLVKSQPVQPTRFTFLVAGSERKLPLDTELNVYRIVSEQIQNVNKHANASRAAVQMLYYDDKLTITTEDDGLGNRGAVSADKPVGIGLKNSSLRAEYIGATLWREVTEAGTLVVLDVSYTRLNHENAQPSQDPADRRSPDL